MHQTKTVSPIQSHSSLSVFLKAPENIPNPHIVGSWVITNKWQAAGGMPIQKWQQLVQKKEHLSSLSLYVQLRLVKDGANIQLNRQKTAFSTFLLHPDILTDSFIIATRAHSNEKYYCQQTISKSSSAACLSGGCMVNILALWLQGAQIQI